MKKKRLQRIIFGLVGLLLLSGVFEILSINDLFERSSVDFLSKHFYSPHRHPNPKMVLIDIDDQTLRTYAPLYGRWPWPRRVYKEILEFLMIGEPQIVLFDILFTEAQKEMDDDTLFTLATQNAGIVSQAIQFLPDSSFEDITHVPLTNKIPDRFFIHPHFSEAPLSETEEKKSSSLSNPSSSFSPPLVFNDYLLPIQSLMESAKYLHVVNVQKDPDGILRRIPLLHEYDGHWLPSLSLEAILSLLQDPQLELKSHQGRQKFLKISGALKAGENKGTQQEWLAPLDKENFFPLHFYPDQERPEVLRLGVLLDSAQKIQKGEVGDPTLLPFNPLTLKDRIVIIGASATGAADLKATPVSDNYPGVLLHTTAISNILNQDFLKTLPLFLKYLEALFIVLIVYSSTLFLNSLIGRTLIPLSCLIIHTLLSIALFKYLNVGLNLTYPLTLGGLALMDSLIYMTFVEGRERRKITGTLSKYLSPAVTQHLIETGIDPSAEVGNRKELTILFSDIRGFTTLSEQLAPERVVGLLNEYLAIMTDLVFQHQGTLDKFIGDAVMAFWGAPLPDTNHPQKAIQTALAMIEALKTLNAQWKAKSYPQFQIGIGINTGEVIVGNIGSDKKLDYTVIGDNVNLTSRLEGLSKYYGATIIVGEQTYQKTKELFTYRPLDLVKVKGKDRAVRIYEPMSPNHPLYTLAEDFQRAWEKYRIGDFPLALQQFEAIQTHLLSSQAQSSTPSPSAPPLKDTPTRLYIERCQELIRNPPSSLDPTKGWDGCFVAQAKDPH